MSEAIGQPGQATLPRPLGIGEILSTAFRLYQRHWRTLLAIAAVVVVPLTLLQYLLGDWLRSRGEITSYQQISTATWAVGAAGLVAALAGILMYLVLTGAITRAVAADQPPGPAHGLSPAAAFHHQGLDAHTEPDPDVDAGDDEQDQPGEGGQPDQDADQQDRSQPVEPEAVALLQARVLAGDLGGHRPGDRPRKDQIHQDAGQGGHQPGCAHGPGGGRDLLVAGDLAAGAEPVAKQVLQQRQGDDHHRGDREQGAPVPLVEPEGGAEDLADAQRAG